jgi:cell division protein FtsL
MAAMATVGLEMGRMQSKAVSRRALSVAERNRELFEQQLSRRRGPTPEMFFAKYIDNSRIVKSDDPVRRREMISFTLTMTVLFLLTMVYVWQHFSAIEVRETNRQLRLTEAKLSDPSRIDTIAKQLGMDQPLPGQVVRQDDPSGAAVAVSRPPAFHAN